jgi:UDP-N-acetylmuramate dehydrogenase
MMKCISQEIPLNKYTTYKTGGNAKYFATPQDIEELAMVLTWQKSQNLPLFILGKGSNLVISDKGFPGMILSLAKLNKIQIDGTQIYAQSGALLHTLVQQSVQAGLAGIENLGGIPGTVGGALWINAGAFEQEIGDVCVYVETMNLNGEVQTTTSSECKFKYRHSGLMEQNNIILGGLFELKVGTSTDLQAKFHQTLVKRKEKQPLHLPNAGSMYKRPPGTYAGKLIEEAGLKGFQMGGAQISPKHSNFVVNVGGATSQDIYDLSEEVILRVRDHSAITLEKEQIFVGDFLPWPR